MNKNLLVSFALLTASLFAHAKPVELDKVAVIVNEGVVLESQINSLVADVKRTAQSQSQSLPDDDVLRTQAIERLILTSLQMQMAERMGIQVSDPQLDQTIANLAREQGISVEQLADVLAEQGISYDQYREEIRTQMITGEVRRANVRRRVYISPQEVNGLVKLLEEQGDAQVEYRLGHILIGLPSQPSQQEIDSERERATSVIRLLENGSDFAKIAVASSAGAKALDGGDMGWMNINEMPTLFAEAVQGKQKDDLIGPIRSGAGFHVLKILDVRGQQTVDITQVKSRHILITPSVILSDNKAKEMLLEFREKLIAGEADFAALAKEYSDDPGSALKGGELGWQEANIFVPEFAQKLGELEIDEYSEPVRTVHGWHLIQLQDRRVQDGSEKLKQDKAYEMLFKRKFAEESDAWMRQMRDEAYISVVGE